jgi:hypothetical protein
MIRYDCVVGHQRECWWTPGKGTHGIGPFALFLRHRNPSLALLVVGLGTHSAPGRLHPAGHDEVDLELHRGGQAGGRRSLDRPEAGRVVRADDADDTER